MATYNKISGVYALRGNGSKIYIGQSTDVMKRTTVNLANRLGLPWTIIHKFEPNTSKQKMDGIETKAHQEFKLAGFEVVSIDRQEVNKRIKESITPDVIRQRQETLNKYWDNPENRSKQAERVQKINDSRTPESRSVSASKGWETRRSRPATNGNSVRTLARRRAEKRRVQP